MKIQKHIVATNDDGSYYNFFFTPGSYNGLTSYLAKGWYVISINDNPLIKQASILLEHE